MSMLEAVERIEFFTGAMDFDSYRNDLKTKSAVERELQKITEPPIACETKPMSYVQALIGRVIWAWATCCATAITRIDDKIIWDTIKLNLPALNRSVSDALSRNFPPNAS